MPKRSANRVDLLCLDAGGVLVFPGWGRVSEALAKHGIDLSPDALASAEPHAKRAFDRDDVVRATTDAGRGWLYFDNLLTIAGVAPSAATALALAELRAYHDRLNLWEHVPADVEPVLERLRALGLRTAVVSNANGRLRELLARLGLDRWFDEVIDSCEVGVEKPDPRIFQLALERCGARAERTVHVGDLYHVDVVGARAAGIHPVLLDAGGLYDGVDCVRVSSLGELADALDAGRL